MRLSHFVTPEEYEKVIKPSQLLGPNGWLLFAATNESIPLAEQVKAEYDRLLGAKGSRHTEVPFLNTAKRSDVPKEDPHRLDGRITTIFEDTETGPSLPYHVAGSDVFVFSNTHELVSGRGVNDNLFELLSMIRALKVNGAKRITAVVPYLPYSRQDKPTTFKREATTAKTVADFFVTAGATGLVCYHPHAEAIRGFYEPDIRYTAISGLDLFRRIAGRFRSHKEVIACSTDAGGAKFTVHFAKSLDITHAIANKYRPGQQRAEILGIIGEIKGKDIALIADDETVTFSSLYNVIEQLHSQYGVPEIWVLISHNKLRPAYLDKLKKAHREFGLKELHVTDTVPQLPQVTSLRYVHTHRLGSRLAVVVNRLTNDLSVSEVFYRPQGRNGIALSGFPLQYAESNGSTGDQEISGDGIKRNSDRVKRSKYSSHQD